MIIRYNIGDATWGHCSGYEPRVGLITVTHNEWRMLSLIIPTRPHNDNIVAFAIFVCLVSFRSSGSKKSFKDPWSVSRSKVCETLRTSSKLKQTYSLKTFIGLIIVFMLYSSIVCVEHQWYAVTSTAQVISSHDHMITLIRVSNIVPWTHVMSVLVVDSLQPCVEYTFMFIFHYDTWCIPW